MTIGDLIEILERIEDLENELDRLQNDDTMYDYIKESKIEELENVIRMYKSEEIGRMI